MKIKSDIHIHTNLSRCARESAVVSHYIEKAGQLGLEKIGFSDHMWDSAVEGTIDFYNNNEECNQNFEHISQIKTEINYTEGLKILVGAEVEYDPFGKGIAVSEEVASRLDFMIVPNSHTHLIMPKEFYEPYRKHADFMLEAYWNIIESPLRRFVTSMAHPFAAVACPYSNREIVRIITDKEFKDCFTKTKENKIAVEINLSLFSRLTIAEIQKDEFMRMFRIAKECGCKFTIGSDSHADTGHDKFYLAYVLAAMLELSQKDFLEI